MISVIIPSYNREKTIERAVRSVLNQSVKDIEVIVVDDGSVDNTREVISQISDNRVKYIYQNNSGACVARNNGIENAKGEYIAFQDSDDSWSENKLERQLAKLVSTGADLVFCQVRRHNYETGDEIYPIINLKGSFVPGEMMINQSMASTQTILAKKEVFSEVKFDPKMPRFQDYDLMIRMAQKYNVAFCDEPLVDVYLQEDSITVNSEKTMAAHKILIDKYQDIWPQYPIAYIRQLNMIGTVEAQCGNKSGHYFWEAFKTSKEIKYLVKYILAKVGYFNDNGK